MTTLRLLAALLILGGALAACSNDVPTGPGSTTDTTGNHNDDTTSAPDWTDSSYNPLKIGNTWTYAGFHNYTVAITRDTSFDGFDYFISESTIGVPLHIRRDSGDFYQTTKPNSATELLTLRERVPIGTTWSNDQNLLGIVYTQSYELADTGLTRTVHGVEFDHVIRVHYKDWMDQDGDIYNEHEADQYFARGIGPIEIDQIGYGVTELVSYSLK